MSPPNETTAKVACRTYDPRRMNWHTEQLSPEGMQDWLRLANATRFAGVTKTMEAAAKESAARPLAAGETNVWDHGQFVPEG